MILAVDLTGFALVITSVATLIGVVANAVVTRSVHHQVRTLNEKSIGELAAAAETRRAESIPHDERTAVEQRHIDESPPVEPPQGPPR